MFTEYDIKPIFNGIQCIHSTHLSKPFPYEPPDAFRGIRGLRQIELWIAVAHAESRQVHEKSVDLLPYRSWTFGMSDETLEAHNESFRLSFILGVEDCANYCNDLESSVARCSSMTAADVPY